jgi:LacI family transcriptional regulator
VVAIAANSATAGCATVDVDNDSGALLATEHLISLGHRKIVHLGGTPGQISSFTRRDAFYRAMEAHGFTPADDAVVETAYHGEIAYTESLRLLQSPNRPTAILAANDHIALSAIRAARELGISVPEQLSVVGYDDAPMAALSDPPLTSIRQPFAEKGKLATYLVLQKIAGLPVEARTHLLPAELVIRSSTGPAH